MLRLKMILLHTSMCVYVRCLFVYVYRVRIYFTKRVRVNNSLEIIDKILIV